MTFRHLSELGIVLLILSQLFRRPLSQLFLDTCMSEASLPGQLVKYSPHRTCFLRFSFGELLKNRPFFSGWFGVQVIMLYFKF